MEIKELFSNVTKLLGAGILSSIGLILISSGRLKIFSTEKETISFLFYLQWQVLGLTIIKLGLDQLVYAWVTENSQIRLAFIQVCKKIILPIAFFILLSYSKLNIFELFIISLSIFFDTFSLISVGTLNALNEFRKTSIASYLNYPLFFF
jgi:hypothetical protein